MTDQHIGPPQAEIERILNQETTTPDELYRARVIRGGRNSIYEACKSGDIEAFRIGRLWIIPTRPLRRKLGREVA